MTLEITIRAGAGGASVIPVPIAYLLDRVEFLVESGGVLVSRHEASQLLWPFRHLSEGQLQLLQRPLNFWAGPSTPEFGTGSNYPKSFYEMTAFQEKTFLLPLLENPFVTGRVFGGAIRSDCYVRCWFRGSSSFVLADGAPAPTLKSLNLIVTQDALTPSARNELGQRYASTSMDWRFFRPGFMSIKANLAPSQ
jgi:hypothetical protein